MAVGNRGAPKSTGAPRTGTVPPAPSLTPAADPTANGKRKKKKKGKGRAESYDDDEDEDVPPPLEHNAYANATAPNATTTNTGLSPQLEATHLATGHMNGPQGTGATIGIGVGIASSDRVRATQEELEATASELFNQFLESPATFGGVNVGVGMGGVPLTQLSGIPMPMGPGSGGADDYWNNLPTQTRDFAQTMYSMAQHVIQTGRVPTSKALPGSYPVSSIPFDPSVLSDPAIKLSLEAAFNSVAANGGFPPISLDSGYHEADYDSEEDGEDIIDDPDGHGGYAANALEEPHPVETTKRKKKKNKKKSAAAVPTPAPAPPPPPITTAPNHHHPQQQQQQPHPHPQPQTRQPVAPPPQQPQPPAPVSNPVSAPNPAPAAARPPQSSRAQGKQPMTYPASNNNTNGTTAPANANTNAAARTPSARAASKQPAYANTNGQQQQQVNGNGKAPSKPRPPANTNSNNPPPAANGKHGHSKHHHGHHGHGIQQDASKIWNTNSHEERERIKDFWLGLAEPERRDLVKVEKEAVLKKMKEQQKHSCSCAVCGRKRNAIEEELEVLYEAYYEDLEAYANLQQRHNAGGGPPPPGPGPFPGSVALDANGSVIGVQHQQHHAASKRNARRGLPPSQQQPVVNGRGAVMNGKRGPPALTHPPNHAVHEEEYDDDGEVDGDEGEYDDEDEDDEGDEDGEGDLDIDGEGEYDEDDVGEEGDEDEDVEDDEGDEDDDGIAPDPRRGVMNGVGGKGAKRKGGTGVAPGVGNDGGRDGDVFSFSSNFTAAGPGKIITVADDLLRNDGQKFLEMMEQLAERRMLREDSAVDDIEGTSDEDSDLDDDGEGDEDEDSDEDPMTDEQKMEEGKRMFSIFAARMFESRVLTAYREKVAQDRQLQLIRELEDEALAAAQKDAKKQSSNQKKKDKKKAQKAAKDEERLRLAAEKASEEAAARAAQAALEEAQRKKREEERQRREAERLRKEQEKIEQAAERRRKAAEDQKRAAEKAAAEQRKAAERAAEKAAREKERKEKEERDRKAKEEAARLERERKAKEDEARREREAKEKAAKAEQEAREAAERKAAAELAQKQAAAAKAAALTSKASPPSPRNLTPAGSSQQPRANATPKKILNKPPQPQPVQSPPVMTRPTPAPAQTAAPPVPAPAPVPTAPASSSNVAGPSTPPPLPVAAPVMATPPMRPPIRPSISTTSSPTPVLTQQPPSMMTPPIAIPGTSHLSAFGQQPLQPIGPPGIGSPQGSFVPHSPLQQVTMNGGFPSHLSYANSFPQPGGIGLGPSALPRGYPTPIEPGFDGSLPFGKAPPPGMPPPIGPPKSFGAPGAIGSGVSLPSPVTGGFPSRSESLGTVNVNGMGGHIRRGSLHEPITPVGRPNPLLPAFGAVQRPMPISRPIGAPGMQQQSDGEERSASPVHLGSSALINDDDDIIMPAGGRRINPSSIVTNGWGAPGEMSKIPNDPFVRGLIGPSSSWSAGGGLHQSPGGLWGAGPVASPGGVNPFMNHHQSPPHQQGMPPMPPFGIQNYPNRPLNPPPSSSPQGN